MLRVIEMFSGIGSQAKALSNIGVEYSIENIIEWDISAFYAYDLIHNGEQDLSKYEGLEKEELINILSKYSLSLNSKDIAEEKSLYRNNELFLKRVLCSIERTKNLCSIVDVKSTDLPKGINVITYSFPCQDLSLGKAWHGNMTGIDRNANNRSGMLWEVERILKEMIEEGRKLPRFLLMENVSNILSKVHEANFEDWKNFLRKNGYRNYVYTLNAKDFGIPQTRKRAFMLSIKSECEIEKKIIENILGTEEEKKSIVQIKKHKDLSEFLRTDYNVKKYFEEAEQSNPNDTPSRTKIYNENILLYDGDKTVAEYVKTITTKQDRNPNAGVIEYPIHKENKSRYRTLTPRECFLLMGFDEKDFDIIIENDLYKEKKRKFYSRERLERLAGNSIVVKILESIFMKINEINEELNNLNKNIQE